MTLTPHQIADGWKPAPDDLDTIPLTAMVFPFYRSGHSLNNPYPATALDWTQDGGDDDIVAYRSA
jgi:hypothetical protein